ncbi:MAG: hypothetical protein AAFP19_07050 [Bacteroidota bacterium]
MALCLAFLFPQSGWANLDAPLAIYEGEEIANPLRQTTIFRSLQRDSILELTIETDLKKLIKGIAREDYQKALLTYKNVDGSTQEHLIQVRPRGKSRRKICDFPPIKLKFKKSHLERAGMNPEYNDLKMVTHCFSSRLSEQKLLREYLAYQMYQTVAEESFRTQLVRIKYVDSQNRMKTIEKYGFILENNEEMADRLGGRLIKTYNLQQNQMQQPQYRELCLFQYMIGNTDWRLDLLHNLKVVRPVDGTSPIAVAYDFDFSGWVDTEYAIPNPDYPLFNVKDRLFICDCTSNKELDEVIVNFIDKKEEMLEIVQNFELIHRKDRKELTKYLNTFFKTLDSPKASQKAFIEQVSESSKVKFGEREDLR